MSLPARRIKNISIPVVIEEQETHQSYEVVPERLGKNGYAAELPALTDNTTLVVASDIINIEKTPLIVGTAASSVTLDSYKFYDFGTLTQSMSIVLNSGTTGYCAEYAFRFTAGEGAGITLPVTCKYGNGLAPTLLVGHTYEYSIVDNLVVVGDFS